MDHSRKLKLAVVMPVWSPMRHNLFQAIGQRPDVSLKVFFEKETIAHRPSWQAVSDAAYEWEIISSYQPEFLKRYRLIPYRLPLFLRNEYPDVIIVVCLTQAIIALLSVCHKKTRVLLWTGESEHILSRRSAPKVAKLLRRILYPFLDGFGCYSRSTMDFLRQRFDIPEAKIFQIPQCIDNAHFKRFAARLPKSSEPGEITSSPPEKKYIFLMVGQLIPLKGIAKFMSAWARLPGDILHKSVLMIVGTGPQQKELKAQAGQLGENYFQFPGFIEFDELPRFYQQADVFILPSQEDTWGFVINEAMASGLPVLCSKYAQAREMVTEGENGFVFDPLLESDTLSKIKRLYRKREEWAQMGQRGREIVEEQYSVEASAEAMMAGVGKILGHDVNQGLHTGL